MLKKFDVNSKFILLLPVIAGIFWGCGGVFVRILYNYGLDSITILSSRVCLATLILFVGLFFFDRKSLKINPKDLWLFIGSGIIGVMFLNLCYNEAALRLSLSLSAVLLNLAPIFAIAFSAVLFDEKITVRKIICVGLAIIGCAFVSGFFDSSSGLSFSFTGMLFGILSAVFWALYGVFSKLISKKGYSTFTTLFYSFLCISLLLVFFTDWNTFLNFIYINPDSNSIFALAHTLFTSILPYLLFTLSIRFIENGKASILCSCAEPISASLFGLAIFGEVLSILNIVGIFLTLLAISLLSYGDNSS